MQFRSNRETTSNTNMKYTEDAPTRALASTSHSLKHKFRPESQTLNIQEDEVHDLLRHEDKKALNKKLKSKRMQRSEDMDLMLSSESFDKVEAIPLRTEDSEKQTSSQKKRGLVKGLNMKKLMSNRMTPEFKLSSEENSARGASNTHKKRPSVKKFNITGLDVKKATVVLPKFI